MSGSYPLGWDMDWDREVEALIDSFLTSLAHLKKLHLYCGFTSSRSLSALPLSYPGPTGLHPRNTRKRPHSSRVKHETVANLEQT